MFSAFVYLSLCSIRNRVRVRLRRLRQPRYLIGSAVGVLYLYTFVFRGMVGRSSARGPGLVALMNRARGPIEFLGVMLLFLVAAGAWALPGSQSLAFSRAEVQFLFQAPVTRRQLVHYKLWRGQFGALFSSVVATILLRPGSLVAGWTFLVGLWLGLAILQLHLIGVSLRRQSLLQHGARGVRRQWLPVIVVIVVGGVLAQAVAADWPTLSTMTRALSVFNELQRLASTGAAGVVLWPFRAVVRLPLSPSPSAFLSALPAVLLLVALNYLWVLRSDTAFEEASAADAEKRSVQRAAPGRRDVKATAPPFSLRPTGRPEIAILWKNLILLGRHISLKLLLRVVPVFVVFTIMFSRRVGQEGLRAMAAVACLIFGGFTIVLGPQMTRNDLRQDLGHLAILKTWPVRGAALLRGELLAPSVVLSVLAWLLIIGGAILQGGNQAFQGHSLAVSERVSFAASAVLIAPGLILTQLLVLNAIAILLPAWAVIGNSRARGVDAMGQRMLMLAGVLLTVVVAILPAAIAAGIAGLLIYQLTKTIPVVVPAIVAAGVMVAECAVVIEILGRVLDRTDVAALEPVE